jgi:hypothetical protein
MLVICLLRLFTTTSRRFSMEIFFTGLVRLSVRSVSLLTKAMMEIETKDTGNLGGIVIVHYFKPIFRLLVVIL